MDEINQLVLAGAPDADILDALAQRSGVDSEEESGNKHGATGGHVGRRAYESCVKIRGRPILPPVMTEELRYLYRNLTIRPLVPGSNPASQSENSRAEIYRYRCAIWSRNNFGEQKPYW